MVDAIHAEQVCSILGPVYMYNEYVTITMKFVPLVQL